VNAPLDDKALDEYLARGSDVSRRYRELDDDTVPPEVDRRVLAEARAAASRSQSGGRAWMRWSAPVALAASAVLVLSIVIESGDQEETFGLKEQVGDARPAKQEVAAPKAATVPAERPVEVFTGVEPDATFEPQAPPPVRAAVPAPSAQARDRALARQTEERAQLQGLVRPQADAEEVQVTANRRREVVMESASSAAAEQSVPRDTIGRSSVSGARASAEAELTDRAFQRIEPQDWLEEIRQLRRDGKPREADLAWEQFRKEFPDYQVAADDIAAKRP
jgi:hypothetical protein